MAEKVITLTDVYSNIDKIKERIFSVALNSWSDADDMIIPGIYHITENFSSIPDTDPGILMVIKDPTNSVPTIYQLYFSLNNKVWYRNNGTDDSFGDGYWVELTQ